MLYTGTSRYLTCLVGAVPPRLDLPLRAPRSGSKDPTERNGATSGVSIPGVRRRVHVLLQSLF